VKRTSNGAPTILSESTNSDIIGQLGPAVYLQAKSNFKCILIKHTHNKKMFLFN